MGVLNLGMRYNSLELTFIEHLARVNDNTFLK